MPSSPHALSIFILLELITEMFLKFFKSKFMQSFHIHSLMNEYDCHCFQRFPHQLKPTTVIVFEGLT